MKRHEELTVLSLIAHLPVLTTRDRIYVCPNGHLGLDTVHIYMGAVGRCVLNTMVGGYNRSDIITALSAMFVQMTRLANRCVTKLDTPYIHGNLPAFKIRTLETTHYEQCTVRLTQCTASMQALLKTLLVIYKTDAETCDQLHGFIQSSYEIHTLLLPILTGLE